MLFFLEKLSAVQREKETKRGNALRREKKPRAEKYSIKTKVTAIGFRA